MTIDISVPVLIAFSGLIIIPVLIFHFLGIGLTKKTLLSVCRMVIQLGLVGLYLEYIFRFNRLWLNLAWMAVMIIVANVDIIRSGGFKIRKFFLPVLSGITLGMVVVVGTFVFIALRPTPVYDARYLIPIAGMVLGNCLRANVISLERFYFSIRKNSREFLGYLVMGASLREAVLPYFRDALKTAVAPAIATMASMGIVSLPGMMTGQILGGSMPSVAIKYQIAIMIAIFTATVITAAVNILLSMKSAFNSYGILKRDIFLSA